MINLCNLIFVAHASNKIFLIYSIATTNAGVHLENISRGEGNNNISHIRRGNGLVWDETLITTDIPRETKLFFFFWGGGRGRGANAPSTRPDETL